jgi:catechol 2,3-dioxygenase-like lactoylglutathione lyase family enzyme
MEIDHIGVICKDLGKSVKHYESLGFVISKDRVTDAARNLDYVFVTNHQYTFELIAKSRDSEPSDIDALLNAAWLSGDRLYHLCLLSDDLEKDIEKHRGMGYKLIKRPESAVACENRKVAFMLHHSFGLIEFLERK